MVLSTHEMRLN